MTVSWINDVKLTLKMLIVWFFVEIDLIKLTMKIDGEGVASISLLVVHMYWNQVLWIIIFKAFLSNAF